MGYSPSYMTWDAETWSGGYGVPAKAVHLRNLAVACDNLMSSITHFYHLAAPSYIQGPAMAPWTPWFNNADYHALLQNPGGTRALPVLDEGFSADLWSAVITQYVKALRIRRLIFEASALFIGRAPMTSNLVAGGVTVNYDDNQFADKCDTFKEIMETEVLPFIAKEYVPVALALSALYLGYDNTHNGGNGWGDGLGYFLAWGNYPQPGGGIAVKGGKVDNLGTPDVFMSGRDDLNDAIQRVKDGLREYITYSRYKDDLGNFDENNAAYPGDVTRTEVDRDGNPDGYSYMKAPRFDGQAREVGPMARLYVNGFIADGQNLLTTVQAGCDLAGISGPVDLHVKTNTDNVTGLNPEWVSADLAVALVRDGLATLTVGTTVYDADDFAGFDNATIVGAYTDPEAVITGTVFTHIAGLDGGISTMDRLRCRAIESLVHVQLVLGWIDDVKLLAGDPTFIAKPTPTGVRKGFGCIDAPRGALAHFSSIDKGKITAYQCVVPYTWNGSPRATGLTDVGATEAALIGVPFDNNIPVYITPGPSGAPTNAAAGGIEVLRVAQSFDPCIACAVH